MFLVLRALLLHLRPGGEELTMFGGANGATWQRTNVYAGGRLLATYDTTGLHFHLTDPLGTRRMQLSGNLASGSSPTSTLGQPETDIQSLPFGDQLNSYPDQYAPASADDSTPLHFTGKERDTESGNDYFGARYYASSMGRFMSPDDGSDQDPSDPQSWNLYGYVRNNPLSNTDPDGRECNVGADGSRTDGTAGGESCADVDRNNAEHPVASVVVHANDGSDNGFEPGSLGAGVFGRANNSNWNNAAGTVNAAFSIEASIMAPWAVAAAQCSTGGSKGACAANMALALLPEVAELKVGATLLKEAAAAGKGAEILQQAGGAAKAVEKFEALPAVAEQVDGPVRIKTLSDGSKAVLYESSSGSGTTISIQNAAGHTMTKIRY